MKIKLFVLFLLFVVNSVLIAAQGSKTAEELADPNGQFIEIDGVSIYYIEEGEAENPAILLLHGFGASTFSWRDNMDALAEAGYRVIAFDRPPYGLSSKSTEIEYNSTYYVQLTSDLMDALQIESAVMVGHSAGGGVIANFAAAYPERVDALIFVAGAVAIEGDSFAAGNQEEGEESSLGGLIGAASGLNPESPFAIAAVRALITPERFAGILTSTYYNQKVVTEEVIAGYQRPLLMEGWERAFLRLFSSERGSTPLAPDTLEALDIPTLLIWGREDTVVPLRAGERLTEFISGAELIVYPEIGHMPMEEDVEQFNADVVGWLEEKLTP
jgi:pimeloyl-ACP methyl ester carboxylesterase